MRPVLRPMMVGQAPGVAGQPVTMGQAGIRPRAEPGGALGMLLQRKAAAGSSAATAAPQQPQQPPQQPQQQQQQPQQQPPQQQQEKAASRVRSQNATPTQVGAVSLFVDGV